MQSLSKECNPLDRFTKLYKLRRKAVKTLRGAYRQHLSAHYQHQQREGRRLECCPLERSPGSVLTLSSVICEWSLALHVTASELGTTLPSPLSFPIAQNTSTPNFLAPFTCLTHFFYLCPSLLLLLQLRGLCLGAYPACSADATSITEGAISLT